MIEVKKEYLMFLFFAIRWSLTEFCQNTIHGFWMDESYFSSIRASSNVTNHPCPICNCSVDIMVNIICRDRYMMNSFTTICQEFFDRTVVSRWFHQFYSRILQIQNYDLNSFRRNFLNVNFINF